MTEEIEMPESESEDEASEELNNEVVQIWRDMQELDRIQAEERAREEEARARERRLSTRILRAARRILTIPSSIWAFSVGVVIPPLVSLQVTTPLLGWGFAVLGFAYAFLGLAQYHGAILASQDQSSALVTVRSDARIKAWAHLASIVLAFTCAQGLTWLWQGGVGTVFRPDLLPFFLTATGTSFGMLYTTMARFLIEQI